MSDLVSAIGERVALIANARRAKAYRSLFLMRDGTPHPYALAVLADLKRFCRGSASTFDTDPRVHALLEGRREVFLRIEAFLGIDGATIAQHVEIEDE